MLCFVHTQVDQHARENAFAHGVIALRTIPLVQTMLGHGAFQPLRPIPDLLALQCFDSHARTCSLVDVVVGGALGLAKQRLNSILLAGAERPLQCSYLEAAEGRKTLELLALER